MIDSRRPLRSTGGLLLRYRGRLAASLVVFVIKDAPLWLMPVITSAVIDTVVEHGSTSHLLMLLGIAVVSLVLNYPTHRLYVRWFAGAVRQVGWDLRTALSERLQELSIGVLQRQSAAVLQGKVVRDVQTVEDMFIQVWHPLLSAILVIIGAVVMTAVAVPIFLPIYALAVPVAILLRHRLHLRSRAANETYRLEIERFSSTVSDMTTLIPITRAHGLETEAQRRVAGVADELRRSGYGLDVLNGRFQAQTWIGMQVLSVLCLGLAADAALGGWFAITPGQVVLVGTYFGLVTGNVSNLLSLTPMVNRGMESVRSIGEVLLEPDVEVNEGKPLVDDVVGDIRFDHMTYRYSPGDEPAIVDVTFHIEPGQTVALVGPSGSGKSTLLNLAMGFLRSSSGRVMLDDLDVEAIDMRSYRRHIAVVPQEAVFFRGTIRDNVTYGVGDVADTVVREALDAANAMGFIENLPQGWDTLLGDRGSRLSGGQRQRLAIARALIRDPRVLFLDEATSALDAESEQLVEQAIARLSAGRTTLVVAHRLSTIRSADTIVVLDHGRVVQHGNHETLLAAGGRYAQLYDLQSHGR